MNSAPVATELTPEVVPAHLISLLREGGEAAYFGEQVTVLQHSLQSAFFAGEAGSSPALISAALLHDVGHLLHAEGEDAAQRGLDTVHEELAARYLSRWFGPALTEPIRLHVPAKRYLCSVDPEYLRQLSPSSIESLGLQGGPMQAQEMEAFSALPHASDALRLRRWDDQAKIVDLRTPPLDSYLHVLEAALRDAPVQ